MSQRRHVIVLAAAFLAACSSRVPATVVTVGDREVEIATAGESDGATTTTVAAGLRGHFMMGKQVWIRPGLSLARGLDARGFDAPLLTRQTTALQIDIPVMF